MSESERRDDMRVITGEARGRKLVEPEGMDIRPTTDKVKEAMFNIIQFSVPGSRVLDLFAGTGQLGIEALSRGADSAVFVDQSREANALIERNLLLTGFANKARLARTDSLLYLKSGEQFDIVFLDPPYKSEMLEKAMKMVETFDILHEGGIMICESDSKKNLPEPESPRYSVREYRYGRVKLTTWTKTASLSA